VKLRGVNISGLEFVAIQGWDPTNPWGGQTGDATPNFSTIQTWAVNAVRLPLNEASWLGLSCDDISGDSVTVDANGNQTKDKPGQIIKADPGSNYQTTVQTTVSQANAAGMYVILNLQWAAPNYNGTPACPEIQNAMADQDHSTAFWTSVATAFKDNPAVIFELFNEPFIGESNVTNSNDNPYQDELNGTTGEDQLSTASAQLTFQWTTAGYQAMLDAVRATGATNVVLVGTDSYDQTMTEWLAYVPADPLKQLAAAWHPYPAAPWGPANQVICPGEPSCSAQEMTAVQNILAAGYPVIASEFGDAITSSPSSTAPWASVLLPWADTNGVSYLGWTWDTWGNSGANVLIIDAAGTPTYGYGTYVKQHYLCVAAGTANCP